MKELIARLRNDCYQEDEVRARAKEAADALERLTTERDAYKGMYEAAHAMRGDAEVEALKAEAENAALREGLDGWHARYLDCEVERDAMEDSFAVSLLRTKQLETERDALLKNAERVRVYKQRYFEAIAERDALRERLDAITKISALDCAIAGEKHD